MDTKEANENAKTKGLSVNFKLKFNIDRNLGAYEFYDTCNDDNTCNTNYENMNICNSTEIKLF